MENSWLLIFVLLVLKVNTSYGAGVSNAMLSMSPDDSRIQNTQHSIQKYNEMMSLMENDFDQHTPYVINPDGTVTFRHSINGVIAVSTCSRTGCSNGPAPQVNCMFSNMVGDINGNCVCAEGYRAASDAEGGGCAPDITCPEGTFPTGMFTESASCQCSNNPNQTIPAGSEVSNCSEVVQREGSNCGEAPDPSDELTDQVDIDRYDACVAAARQAEIDAQRLENQSAAAGNAATAAQNNLDSAIDAEAGRLAQSCRASVQEFNSSCSSVRRIPQANTNTSGASTRERCESLSQTSKSGIESVKEDISRCVSKFNSLSSSCPTNTSTLTGNGESTVSDGAAELGSEVVATESSSKSGSGAVPGVAQMIGEASQINSRLVSQAAQVEEELSKLEESSAQCIAALEDNPDHDPTANKFLSQAQSFASSAHSGSGSFKGGGYGSSELSSGSGYATGKAFGETAKGVYDKLRGRDSGSLSPSGGLGDNMAGISDEAVLGNGSGGQAYSPTGGASGGARSGGAKTTSAGNLRGNSSSNSKVGANARKKRRSKTAKARNLAQGYKTMKATDGGSSFSIKPSSFKKYGSKVLKQKLAEARKLHGKDMPLIFRNGKFVLDFLAMKESRGFKARTSAMESYLKGGQRKSASVADLHVHQDSKLNIFKIMNFRYQRQSFNKAND